MDFSPPSDVNHHLGSHAHPYNTPQSAASGASFSSPFRNQSGPIPEAGASRAINSGGNAHHMLSAEGSPGMNNQTAYYGGDSGRNSLGQSASPPTAPSQYAPNPSNLPSDRSLPSREATDEEGFENAYVAFILYCNPSFPPNIDTTDLRKNFSSPPRSDGKIFSTLVLFELLKKLESKEIKTWTELALELGVEKPAIDKGQSSQKVQQYSVRLKRWLRASHIDAFFDYMIGKGHSYIRDIPPIQDPFPDSRDGVFIEDDLALRALKPEFRPKRGRRRNDEQDDDMEPMSAIEPKRPHLDTSVAFSASNGYPHSAYPGSGIPMSAHPDDMDRFPGDHWVTPASLTPASAARQPSTGGNFRWRVNENPTTPHPMSAVTPTSAHPDSAFEDPQSAMTASQKLRMRRRHGTAVSSAWPSNTTTPNGKLRGRPPTNRSVKDGPFVTFPANPKNKEGPAIDLSRNHIMTPSGDQTPSGPHPSQSPNSPFRVPQMPTPVSATSQPPSAGGLLQRPERLSLQVPQHVGNPVRLVTPTVLVNGEEDQPRRPDSRQASVPYSSPAYSPQHGFPNITNEDLKRALAADLLRADITGRSKRLRGTEAKDLAEALLAQLRSRRTERLVDGTSPSDDAFRVTCASWLGLTAPAGSSSGLWSAVVSAGGAVKKIYVRRFRVGGDGYDSPIDDGEDEDAEEGGNIKETFDIEWELAIGGLSGKFQVKALTVPDSPGVLDEKDEAIDNSASTDDSAAGWRQRFLAMEKKLKAKDDEVKDLKDRVLEAVL